MLITNPRDLPGFVAETAQVPFMFFSGREHAVQRAAATRRASTASISARCAAASAAAWPCRRAVAERWKQVTGNVLTQAWGLTETSPAACINPLAGDDFNGSIGLPIPSTEISIRDDDGNELPHRRSRRDLRRGPQVMRGYWNRPDETAKVMLARRLAAHRRHRPHGRARLRVHRGPQEGHDPRVRLQRVSERGRGRRRHAPGVLEVRRRGAAGRASPARSSRCSSCRRTRR